MEVNSAGFILFGRCVCQSPAHLLLPFVGVGRGWWWVCSAALVRQKNEVPLLKCGLLFETCRILKVRNRDVWESPMCQPARGSEHLCTGWEGTSASESTWIAGDKCSGMAGKLPCLQLFLSFVYLFFFMVLNITSLSLLLVGECFQGLGLHFRLSKEIVRGKKVCPQTVGPWEGLSWVWEKGAAVLPVKPICGAVLAVSGSANMGGCKPERALLGYCLEHHTGLQQCVPVSLLLIPAAWQLPEKFGWAAWLSLLHLSNPLIVWLCSCIPFRPWQRWGRYTAWCSLVRQQQTGPLCLGCVPLGSVLLPSNWRAMYWVLAPLTSCTECWTLTISVLT